MLYHEEIKRDDSSREMIRLCLDWTELRLFGQIPIHVRNTDNSKFSLIIHLEGNIYILWNLGRIIHDSIMNFRLDFVRGNKEMIN